MDYRGISVTAAVLLVIGAGILGFAVGQNTTCVSFLGFNKTCVVSSPLTR